MRFVFRLILIGVLTYLVGWQLPQWPVWPVVVVAFLVGLLLSKGHKRSMFIRRKPPKAFAFWAGFVAVFLVWGAMAWRIDVANQGLLSSQMLSLLTAGRESDWPSWSLVGITALLGALLGGFGAMTGNLLGEALKS